MAECLIRCKYFTSGEPSGTSLGASDTTTWTAEMTSLTISMTKSAELAL